MPSPALERAVAWLDHHINLEATAGRVEGLSLERMRSLAKAIGDPQLDFPVVHVTGTNGKGSTSAIIAAVLASLGLTVGTYASPHVSAIGERILGNGEPIPDDELAALLDHLAAVEGHLPDRPSWFELMTAAAYRWFADIAADVAVVEVGKLGRYDATNVVDAAVAVVTNVGFDHTDGAPGWRRKVAWEKAGIIGPGATLCLGERDPELFEVFEAENPAAILRRDRDFFCTDNRLAVGGRLLSIKTPAQELDDVFLSLNGAHQGRNASIAVAAAEAFVGDAIGREVIDQALGTVTLPGRFEVLSREPLIIVDGAHNPDGAASAVATFDEGFAAGGRRVLLVGLLRERDPVRMLEGLRAASFDQVVCMTPPSPRAMEAAEIGAAAGALGIECDVIADAGAALDHILAHVETTDAVLAAGSLFVAGAVRDELLSRRGDEL